MSSGIILKSNNPSVEKMIYAKVSSNFLFDIVTYGTLLVEYPSYELMFVGILAHS
jgi:hypothetical protein